MEGFNPMATASALIPGRGFLMVFKPGPGQPQHWVLSQQARYGPLIPETWPRPEVPGLEVQLRPLLWPQEP